MSSEAIFDRMTGIPVGHRDHLRTPSDPSDLRRCRALLEAVPEFAARLDEMATVSTQWAKLCAAWSGLCALMDEEAPKWRAGEGKCPRTWMMMSEILYGEKPRTTRMETRE